MRKVLSFFVVLLVSLVATTAMAQDELTRCPVFTMGENGSQYYRIPALVQTANGTLVAIADDRGSALGDLPNIISIVAKTSTDGGQTWSSITTIAQGNATAGTTYGDAVAVYDEETGKIITVFVGNENYGSSCVGLWASNSSYPLRLYKSESSDNGATWTTPVDISNDIYNSIYGSRTSWVGMFAGSGSGVQLKKGDKAGRLMFVVAARANSTWGGAMSNYAVYSDDNGATWQVSSNAACTSGDEAKIVELENGDLLMSIKNRKDDSANGSGYRLMAKSTDQGATWTTADVNTKLKDPACNGDVVSIEYDGKYYLLHSLPASTSDRENVTVYASLDGGETWPISRQIYDGYSAYSALQVLNDGTIGIIVEEGKWDSNYPGTDGFNLAYYNFTMEWLMAEANFDAIEMVEEANSVLSLGGIGYPNAIAKAALRSAVEAVEADASAANVTALASALETYYTTNEIERPQAGKTYTFISRGMSNDYYIYNDGGTLALESYTEGDELPDAAKFTCEIDSETGKYMFKTFDEVYYLAYPTIGGKSWLDNESETGLESTVGQVTKFDIEKIILNANVSATAEDLFGYVHLWGYRGYDNGKLVDMEGPVIVKSSAGTFDGAGDDYYNVNFSSAFTIKPVQKAAPIILDRSAWTVTASSDEPAEAQWGGGGEAKHTIDDDTNTFWHTQWDAATPTVPHWIQFNMGESVEVTAFNYVSRSASTNQNNGQIKTYKLYISDSDISANLDPTTSEPIGLEPASEGEFTYDGISADHNVELAESVVGQYVFLLALDSYNVDLSGVKFANCSEFFVTAIPAGPAPTTYTVTVTANPSAGGTATVNGAATAEVVENAKVTFTATEATGYEFVNWTYTNGQEVTTEKSFRMQITGAVELVANFNKLLVETNYCTVSGNINSGRHLAGFSISNGKETIDVQGVADGGAVYVNRSTTSILEAKPGTVITFPSYNWTGQWMHSYVYIDYDGDYSFNTDSNNDGTTGGELVTFNYFNGSDINGKTSSQQFAQTPGNSKSTYTNDFGTSYGLPAFKLPADLAKGDYRLRVSVAWNTKSPCGYSDIKPNNGILLDMTLRIVGDQYVVTVASSDEEMGSAYIGTEGTTTQKVDADNTQTLELTAVANEAYEFVNWTLGEEVVSTEAVFTTTAITENRDYLATFKAKAIDPRTVTVVSNNDQKGTVAFVSPEAEEGATEITTGEWVTVKALPQTEDDFFVNWTIDDVEVGTDIEYIYKGAEAVTIKANFISKYLFTFSTVGNGDVTFSTEEGGVASGTRIEEGTVVKYVATPAYGYELTSITLNSTEILDQKYQEAFSGEFTMNSSNEMAITFAELTATLTYAYSGSGYIEVWSDDVQEGELFSNEATIPFNSELYVFSYPQGEYELQSLTINGETTGEVGSYLDEMVEYGSVYHSVVGDVAIEAVFTGPNLVGVEGTEAETVSVYANDGTIFVSGFNGAIQVVNISGQVVKEVVANGKTQITMAQGIYFVVTDNQVTKVVVK